MHLSRYVRQVLLIILVGVSIRLIGFDQPLLEGAMTRQLQTAEITYNLYTGGFDIFHPQIHVLPEPRYFIFEFPIYNTIVALLYKVFGVHEFLGRAVSIAAFAGTAWFIWLIASRRLNESIGRASVFAYSFFPLSIIYTRAFQPDSLGLFFAVGSFSFFSEWLHKKKRAFLPAFILGVLAFLTKQIFAFILLPMCLYALYHQKALAFKNLRLYLFMVFVLVPALWWTWYGKQVYLEFPNYLSGTNLNYGDWFNFEFFLKYEFYKTIFHWLTGIVMTPLGFFLFLMGFFVSVNRDGDRLILFWMLGVVVFNFLFPLHAFTHEYYHLPLLPVASIMAAKSWWFFFEREEYQKDFNLKLFKMVGLTAFFIVVLGYSNSAYRLPSVARHFKQNTALLNQYTRDEDLIIVTDRYHLYYGNNKGWVFHLDKYNNLHFVKAVIKFYAKDKTIKPTPINYIESLRQGGASYFLVTRLEILNENPRLADYLRKHYTAVEVKGISLLFDLRKSLF